jgi:uncharacterized protein (DUF433 family)
MATEPQTISQKYIEIRPSSVVGPKAYIAGTRISVENVYVCHELQGMTADEIVAAYPHLRLAQVHAALAYFFERPEEIREQMKQSKEFASRMEAEQGPTRFTRLRDELLKDKDGHDDTVSSG